SVHRRLHWDRPNQTHPSSASASREGAETMLTGAQYLESLRDDRRVFLDGVLVDDVTADPGIGPATAIVAAGYDRFYDPSPAACHPCFSIPRSVDELRDRAEVLVSTDVTASLSAVAMALLTAAPALAEAQPAYADRIRAYFADCVARDVRFAEVITDAKGDRTLPPSRQEDPDLYLRIVDRDTDGIVITGAKFHITAAPVVHELVVMPTKRMKPGEDEYAVACAVPADAPGVTMIAASHHPRGGDWRSHPVSERLAIPDATVIFDHVRVPWDRVFLAGEVEHSAAVAHALGLWERLSGCAHLAHLGDLLAGIAQLIAEANGTERIPHIKDKIADIVLYATLTRAGLEAAVANCEANRDGLLFPNELYTNAAKLYAATNYSVMVRHLHDIAGGTVATAPTIADLENPDLRPYIEKYLRGAAGISGEYRLRLFHLIRNLTADEWGGREAVSWLQSGGGLFAQRTVLRNRFDMAAAKRLALDFGGLTDKAPQA
ncbi:MAG: 4-hydroxyphenylacetate 3-hydroxylase N-terminal domain-containing protein, partial [Acidimicrobiales bacterium]